MRRHSKLKDNPRALAVQILNRVDRERSFAEPLLDSVLSSGRPRAEADRGLLTFLVYGTLRMRGLLDFLIDRFHRGKPSALEPGVRNILRVESAPEAGRPALLREIDAAGVVATPANSSYNELVVEAGRQSILSGGREVRIPAS